MAQHALAPTQAFFKQGAPGGKLGLGIEIRREWGGYLNTGDRRCGGRGKRMCEVSTIKQVKFALSWY